jgi:hypothetical protein
MNTKIMHKYSSIHLHTSVALVEVTDPIPVLTDIARDKNWYPQKRDE